MAYLTNVSIEIEGKNAGKALKNLLPGVIVEAEDDATYAVRSIEAKYVDNLLNEAKNLSESGQYDITLTGDGEEKTDVWTVKFENGEKTTDVTFSTLLKHYIDTEKIKLRVKAAGENAADALKELFGLEKVNHTTIIKYINSVSVFIENALKVSKKYGVTFEVYGITNNGFDAWYRQFEQGEITYFKDFFNYVENDPARTKPKPEPGKEVVERKSYHIETKKLKDGTVNLNIINKGFPAIELLGLLSMATRQIMDTLENATKPDRLERRYEKADKEKD